MEIYVVQPGDTIESIAAKYQVSPYRLIQLNELTNPENLVVGQTIVILIPEVVYTVQEGDTLYGIADAHGISIVELYQNNPQLVTETQLYPGEELVIKYQTDRLRSISVLGYAYPYIDRQILRKTLPYLTYLSVFSYGFTTDGGLISIDDQEVINLALDYGTAPLMVLAPLDEAGQFSNQRASELLNNPEAQEVLIQNVLGALYEKGYQGVDLDFEYIFATDREKYVNFINELRRRLNAEGYIVNTALAPKVSADQPGLLYERHDYGGIGAASNYVLLMTYEWGYTYGPPMAVSPIGPVRNVLEYAVTEMPPNKILMGQNLYGYDWTLPYKPGNPFARAINPQQAIQIARERNAAIEYDTKAQAPFFHYWREGKEHEVWFEDARSIQAKFDLLKELGLRGISYWHSGFTFPQNWYLLNDNFRIRKI